MAGHKRKTGNMNILNRPELLVKINSLDSERDRALVAFLYLTGARISEIVGRYTKLVKHYKKENGVKVLVKEESINVCPLKKESIEILQDRDLILVHNIPCLKHKYNVPRRNIPIIISKEQPFLDIFLPYFSKIGAEKPLFDITRQRAWQIMKEKLGLFNHYLIHERVTHLVTNQNFREIDIKEFRGWSDTRPASVYSHLNWTNLADRMRK